MQVGVAGNYPCHPRRGRLRTIGRHSRTGPRASLALRRAGIARRDRTDAGQRCFLKIRCPLSWCLTLVSIGISGSLHGAKVDARRHPDRPECGGGIAIISTVGGSAGMVRPPQSATRRQPAASRSASTCLSAPVVIKGHSGHMVPATQYVRWSLAPSRHAERPRAMVRSGWRSKAVQDRATTCVVSRTSCLLLFAAWGKRFAALPIARSRLQRRPCPRPEVQLIAVIAGEYSCAIPVADADQADIVRHPMAGLSRRLQYARQDARAKANECRRSGLLLWPARR